MPGLPGIDALLPGGKAALRLAAGTASLAAQYDVDVTSPAEVTELATEAGATNLRYGLQNYLMNDADYMLLYSVEGGNERIIEELVRRTRMEVRLATRVERVRGLAGGGVELGVAGGEELRCDHAVLALPQPQLAALAFEGEALGEDMREHLAHHDHPAHYLRVSILFERPFWRGVLNESFLMLEAFGGCCLYDESSRTADARHGVLGWLMGGQAAVELEVLGRMFLDIQHQLEILVSL